MRQCHFAFYVTLILTGCGVRTPATSPPTSVAKQEFPPPPTLPHKDAPPGYFTPAPPGAVSWMKAEDKDPIPQDREKGKKLEADSIAWNQSAIVGAFEKHGNTKAPWADLARTALNSIAIRNSIRGHRLEHEADVSRKALAAAVAAGCDDPQVMYFHIQSADITPETARKMKELADRFEAEKYPIYRRMHARWNACAYAAENIPDAKPALKPSPTNRRGKPPRADTVAAYESAWPLITELASVRDTEVERSLFELAVKAIRLYDDSGHDRREGFEKLMKAIEAGDGSVWLRKMIEGHFYVEYAWDARGNSVANDVPNEAWPLFQERLQKAEAALEAAWKANPTRPEPCLQLMTVAIGLSHDRDYMEKWFRRAMTVDPNNFMACNLKANYLNPKWHGSKEELLAFGRQCARTQNWDAELPHILLLGVFAEHGITDFNSGQFQYPEVWADCRELFEPYLLSHPDDQYVRTVYGKICLSANQYGSAYFHFSKLNGKPWLGQRTFPDEKKFQKDFERAQHVYYFKEVKK